METGADRGLLEPAGAGRGRGFHRGAIKVSPVLQAHDGGEGLEMSTARPFSPGQLEGGVIGVIIAVRIKYLFLFLNDRMTVMTVYSRTRRGGYSNCLAPKSTV